MLTRLDAMLREANAQYELISHEKPILSAKDGEELLGISIGETAPIIIVRTDHTYLV